MRQPLWTATLRISWDLADGRIETYGTTHGFRAPSVKAANARALRYAMALPCFADRAAEGLRVEAEVSSLVSEPVAPEAPDIEIVVNENTRLGAPAALFGPLPWNRRTWVRRANRQERDRIAWLTARFPGWRGWRRADSVETYQTMRGQMIAEIK